MIEFCSAWRCTREKARIKELFRENEELKIERDQLAAGQDCTIYFDEIDEINEENDVRFLEFFKIEDLFRS